MKKEMKNFMCRLTILTPSYNRAQTLPKLYESLKRQTVSEFCWLLVDDGSSDGTGQLAQEWQQEGAIAFSYLYKENGGKHTALNLGIAQIETELTFIVDSDDWLPENAVERILYWHEKYRDNRTLCGYSFLRFYPDGKVNTAYFPESGKIDTYVNVRINGHIGGDKAEVFRTDILKQFPFPVFAQERFLPEDLVWVKMSGPYPMVHLNECVYISEYLEDGLTKSGRRMKAKSPLGMMARSRAYLEDGSVNGMTKLKMMLLYQIYGRQAGFSPGRIRREAGAGALYWICRIPAGILYAVWKRKYGFQDLEY